MVSIIIPYIDEIDFLAEAIDSAASQRDVVLEIIAVCNAPGESSVPNKLKEKFGKVKFIHEPRPGSAHARNRGLAQASGEWIQFLDVDDLLEPSKICSQISATNADVIVSPHTFLFLDGRNENSKWLTEDIWIGILNSGLGSTSSMLFKRQALTDIGGWNAEYQSHQEYELLFRLATAGKKIETYGACLTTVRQRQKGSITLTTRSIRANEGIKLREAMWTHLQHIGKDTPERFEAFRQYIFRQLRGLFRQDPTKAIEIYRKYFSTIPFTPKEIHVPGYSFLYTILGFERAESLILFFKGK